jgi:outer membrane lipoprotein-sorting protein
MNSSKRTGILISVAALILFSCALPSRPKTEMMPIVQVKDVDELFTKTMEKNSVHETLKAQAKVKVSSPSDNYSVTELIFSKRPSFVRLETIGPLGQTLLFLTTDIKKVYIYSPTENRFYTGLASRKNLSLLVPLPFKAADIIDLFQGRIDLSRYVPQSMSFDELKGIYEVQVIPNETGLGMVVLTVDARTFSILTMRVYDQDNNLTVDGAFGDFAGVGTAVIPRKLTYNVPNQGVFVKIVIEYDDVQLDVTLDDSRFVLDTPRGVQEIDLDKSIINFSRAPVQ